jgi:hypothetical protein
MFQPSNQGADASIFSPAPDAYNPKFESIRHLLFGSPVAVRSAIALLHKLNYAEPNDWSKPVPTGQANEVVVVLIKRVRTA